MVDLTSIVRRDSRSRLSRTGFFTSAAMLTTLLLSPFSTQEASAQSRGEGMAAEAVISSTAESNPYSSVSSWIKRNGQKVLVFNASKDETGENHWLAGGVLPLSDGKIEFRAGAEVEGEDKTFAGYGTLNLDLGEHRFRLRAGIEDAATEHDRKRTAYVSSRITDVGPFSFLGVAGNTSNVGDNKFYTDAGLGAIAYFPGNFFASAGLIHSTDSDQGETLSIAGGRYSSFFGETLPTGFFVYRGNDQTDFTMVGLAYGGRNQLVEPALTGITTGFFNGAAGLSNARGIRRFSDVGADSDDYLIGTFVAFAVDVLTNIPGTPLHAGAREVDLYFSPVEGDHQLYLLGVLGEETVPNFRSMKDERIKYVQAGTGVRLNDHLEVSTKFDFTEDVLTINLRVGNYRF